MGIRTTEQKQADEALAVALDALHRAYDEDGEAEGILIKFVVVSQRQWWDEEGESWTMVYINAKDGEVPMSDQLGLCEFASTRIRHAINTNDDGDDD